MFYIGLYKEKLETKKFLSEISRPRALSFCMKHHLVNFYQVCSIYISLGAKNGTPRGHMFNIGLYRETNENNLLV